MPNVTPHYEKWGDASARSKARLWCYCALSQQTRPTKHARPELTFTVMQTYMTLQAGTMPHTSLFYSRSVGAPRRQHYVPRAYKTGWFSETSCEHWYSQTVKKTLMCVQNTFLLSVYSTRDGNGLCRVRVKHLPARWHTRLALLYPYPPNVTGKNPYPCPQGKRYPMGININMSLSSYIRVQ
jgi:hypothetical protein